MASYLRGGLWFLLYVATQFGVEAATWTLGHNLGLGVLAGLAGVALTFVLWLATPHLLLGKDLGGWRGLVPTATAGTVVTVGLRLLSLLLLPRWLASWAIPFGAIGTSIALLLVVQLLATGWVVVAALAPSTGSASPTRTPSSGQNSTAEPPSRRRTVRLTGGRTTMVDDSDHQMQHNRAASGPGGSSRPSPRPTATAWSSS